MPAIAELEEFRAKTWVWFVSNLVYRVLDSRGEPDGPAEASSAPGVQRENAPTTPSGGAAR
jgi:hypothetical protein